MAAYSGGMRRRLDLAMTLVGDPRIILLDEPTTGLHPRSRRTVWETIRELVARGVTIFLTTQYLEEADELAGRLRMLTIGQLAAYTGVTVRAIRHHHQRGAARRAALDDPEFRRIYALGDQALDWDPADPRIAELADAMAAWAASSRDDSTPVDESSGHLAAEALMASHIVGSSPSWQRRNDLSQKRLEELRNADGHP